MHLTALPTLGILLPSMGSQSVSAVELPSLFGKTRQTLLSLLYGRADEEQLQENLIEFAGLGRGAGDAGASCDVARRGSSLAT